MFAEITAAISGIKNAYELLCGLKAVAVDNAVKEKTEELMDSISSLRHQLFEIQVCMTDMHDAKVKVEKELENIHAWDREIAPYYRMIALADGVLAYAQREPAEGETSIKEPAHYLCTRCFHDQRKAILQRQGYEIGGMVYKCEFCGNTVCNHADKPPSWGPVSVPRRDPFPGH